MLRSFSLFALFQMCVVSFWSSSPSPSSHFALAASSSVSSLFPEFFPLSRYESKSSSQKANLLWSRISSTAGSSVPFPPTDDHFFGESMLPAFDHDGDLFPDGRTKAIHTAGIVSRVELQITNPLNYTGIFSSGCANGVMRFSSKGTPDGPDSVFIPAFAIKCLRDHVPSANMFGQRGVMIEPSKTASGFFSHPWTSHLPLVGAGPAAVAIRQKFTEVSTAWPSAVGSVSVAQFDASGTESYSPYFPWQLIWVETPQLNAAAKKYSSGESVTVYDQIITVGQHLPIGTPLFDLYVQDVNGAVPVKLGQLLMRSKWIRSTFADQYLFFKHTRVPDDLAARPELNVCPLDSSCTNWCPEVDHSCAVWNTNTARNRRDLARVRTPNVHQAKKIANRKAKATKTRRKEAAKVDEVENENENGNAETEEDENDDQVETEDHVSTSESAPAGCPFSLAPRRSKEQRGFKQIVRHLEEKLLTLEEQILESLDADAADDRF